MKKTKKTVSTMAILATMNLCAPGLHSATITWDVFDISGNVSDISTSGTLVDSRAGAAYGGSGVTGASFDINGVTFDDDIIIDNATHNDTIAGRAGTYDSENSAYFTLLNNTDRNSGGLYSITFSDLTLGQPYQVQIWVADNVQTAGDRAMILNDGSTTNPDIGIAGHPTLLFEAGSEGSYGQYALGTFTADATSQSFKAQSYEKLLTTPNKRSQGHINAVQLRAIPEPGTALLGLAGLGLMLRRRRRRS